MFYTQHFMFLHPDRNTMPYSAFTWMRLKIQIAPCFLWGLKEVAARAPPRRMTWHLWTLNTLLQYWKKKHGVTSSYSYNIRRSVLTRKYALSYICLDGESLVRIWEYSVLTPQFYRVQFMKCLLSHSHRLLRIKPSFAVQFLYTPLSKLLVN